MLLYYSHGGFYRITKRYNNYCMYNSGSISDVQSIPVHTVLCIRISVYTQFGCIFFHTLISSLWPGILCSLSPLLLILCPAAHDTTHNHTLPPLITSMHVLFGQSLPLYFHLETSEYWLLAPSPHNLPETPHSFSLTFIRDIPRHQTSTFLTHITLVLASS